MRRFLPVAKVHRWRAPLLRCRRRPLRHNPARKCFVRVTSHGCSPALHLSCSWCSRAFHCSTVTSLAAKNVISIYAQCAVIAVALILSGVVCHYYRRIDVCACRALGVALRRLARKNGTLRWGGRHSGSHRGRLLGFGGTPPAPAPDGKRYKRGLR